MSNKMLANCIISTFVLTIVAAVFETDYYYFANDLYTLAGLGYFVFGIWAVVRLYKIK